MSVTLRLYGTIVNKGGHLRILADIYSGHLTLIQKLDKGLNTHRNICTSFLYIFSTNFDAQVSYTVLVMELAHGPLNNFHSE